MTVTDLLHWVRALLVLAGLGLTVALLVVIIQGTWSMRRGSRRFGKAMNTGDLSKLDPNQRELVDEAIRARPDFGDYLEHLRQEQAARDVPPDS